MKRFLTVAIFWFLGIGAISGWTSPAGTSPWVALSWCWGLAILALVDFLAIAGLMRAVFRIMVPPEKTHPEQSQAPIPWGVQAVLWGSLKLFCLALLALLLYRGGRSIPLSGIVFGPTTLVIVPMVGGFWVYRRG